MGLDDLHRGSLLCAPQEEYGDGVAFLSRYGAHHHGLHDDVGDSLDGEDSFPMFCSRVEAYFRVFSGSYQVFCLTFSWYRLQTDFKIWLKEYHFPGQEYNRNWQKS
jgi:hypothetical protein